MYKSTFNIILGGGSTGGPNAPLIATAKKIQEVHEDMSFNFLLVAPKNSPAKRMSDAHEIPFESLPEAKLHRYISIGNLVLPFKFIYAFLKALKIVARFKPNIIYGGGGFSQVPLVFAGVLFRVPVVIHQQDVKISLSNQICAGFAKKITVSFEESVKSFPEGWFLSELEHVQKTVFTGNPSLLPAILPNRKDALENLGLQVDMPTILFMGGGGGAQALNVFVEKSVSELTKHFQVILITGPGKSKNFRKVQNNNLKILDFVEDMTQVYAAADIVVARAGMSTITELSKYRKLSIIIPMPNTHQEYNAELLYLFRAAIVLDQTELDAKRLINLIRKLLFDVKTQEKYRKNIFELLPKDAEVRSARVLWEVLNEK